MLIITIFRSIQTRNTIEPLKEDVGRSNGMLQSALITEHLATHPMYGAMGYFFGKCILKESNLMKGWGEMRLWHLLRRVSFSYMNTIWWELLICCWMILLVLIVFFLIYRKEIAFTNRSQFRSSKHNRMLLGIFTWLASSILRTFKVFQRKPRRIF